MQARRKVFRVEAMKGFDLRPRTSAPHNGDWQHEIISELKALRSIVEPQEVITERMIEAYKAEIAEAQKLKSELDTIYSAINQTKHEIATLHISGFEGPEMTRVTHELDAVVGGTQSATEQILSSAEAIDQIANTLSAKLKDEQDQQLVHDIQEHVIRMFEACNFQDLTGQRISKVVTTLKFIEEHIVRMMDIWGGIESFKDQAPDLMEEREGDCKLLNGPKLDGEDGHASQNDIDALFN
ncbi:MAG TPA: protein phosphatase CheZ [Xanthobacteraceae bacterium]|jgi:chemotaxis protein CheZ|nr:protein phosphatase CheZ [Xanthobacteraceae bacterium]